MIDVKKLRDMGLNIIPLEKKSKKPIKGFDWMDYKEVKYEKEIPDEKNAAVIGGRISGNLVVIDGDSKSIKFDFPEFEDTFIVETPNGFHWYFRYYGDWKIPNAKLFDKPPGDPTRREIDIKAEGGYVVAPGSIHPKGGEYKIINDVPIKKIEITKLREILNSKDFRQAKKSIREISEGVSLGERDESMFRYCLDRINNGGITGEALQKLAEELNQRFQPPMSDADVKKCVKSAHNYAKITTKKPVTLDSFRELGAKIDEVKDRGVKEIDLTEFRESLREFEVDHVKALIKDKIEDAEFNFGNPVKIHEIKPSGFDMVPSEFRAMVIAAGERQTYVKEGDYTCQTCGDTVHLHCDHLYRTKIPFCKSDSSHGKCVLDDKTKITPFIQQIRLRELQEDCEDNNPLEYNAEVLDENVRKIKMGDRKLFVARFRSIPTKNGPYNDIVFEILDMRDVENKDVKATEEDLNKWKESDVYETAVRSVFSSLEIGREIKESFMYAIVGGDAPRNKRTNIHICMMGDPGLGKSEMFKEVADIMAGGYAVSTQASKVGMTVSMTTLYNGTMVPKGGLLTLHNKNLVCIDEVNHMDREDVAGLYSSMEQGIIKLNKAGYSDVKFDSDTTVIAGGNPKHGIYDPGQSIMDNFGLDPPFLSRFDLLWLLVDNNTEKEDDKIIDHIYAEELPDLMDLKELRKFFTHARKIEVTVPATLQPNVRGIYHKLREIGREIGIRVGIRQFYGIHRMVCASAKLHLRDEATIEDVNNVIRVMESSYSTLSQGGVVKFMSKKDQVEADFNRCWSECVKDGDVDVGELTMKLREKNVPDEYLRIIMSKGLIYHREWDKDKLYKPDHGSLLSRL